MAWMRMMGVDSVEYHRATVLARGDDYPGQALGYYDSRGETPLLWGGHGAQALGLESAVTEAQYAAIYGIGGALDPTTGERLVSTKRPGMELVISAHKSVAELGVIGRTEDMHAIMDAERDATLAYLDDLTQRIGGRRGREARRTSTDGLVYAVARHATSRAGDPCPHDHVLLANVVHMGDDLGGWKAADTAMWREHLHAATVVGRMASASKAIELGYAIEADPGPSGRLGHWAIAGVPEEVMEKHSKRAAEIDAEMDRTGHSSYRARQIAARETRGPKRHEPVGDLLPGWVREIEAAGWGVDELTRSIDAASAKRMLAPRQLGSWEVAHEAARALAPDGPLAKRKVFSRRDVIVATGPALYGRNAAELDRVVDRTLADPEAVPLLGVAGAHERAYATATTIAREQAIARAVESQAGRTNAPAVSRLDASRAITAREALMGAAFTDGQRRAVEEIATSGRGVELVVGVAGAGKTTALAALRHAFEAEGYEVLGTSTSGQAARTLGREAEIIPSRTLASLTWRLDHGQMSLGPRSVVICDESSMTTDADLLRLLVSAETADAKVIMVGDPRQLGAVGPGGGFEALCGRFGGAVHVLDENVRQRDVAERAALAELRAGDVWSAVGWYGTNGRIVTAPDRDAALDAVVAGWTADVKAGSDTAMLAWKRANVAELNVRGREAWDALGRLSGPELVAPGGTTYRAGDRIVTLAPGSHGGVVTSECGRVFAFDRHRGELLARMDDDGRLQRFGPEGIDAAHLAYGYALTAHRAQGATVDRTHTLEDGGGRELAYVKMSRARERSTVYVVADSIEQAFDDLRREWTHDRRIGWAIDTGTPERERGARIDRRADRVEVALQRGQLQAERDAVAAAIPPDPLPEIRRVEGELHQLRKQRDQLTNGLGPYANTLAGQAADERLQAQRQRIQAEGFINAPLNNWSSRLHWRSVARRAAAQEHDATGRWEEAAAPELARITDAERSLTGRLGQLEGTRKERSLWLEHHPEAGRRLDRLDARIEKAEHPVRLARDELNREVDRQLNKTLERPTGRERVLERPGPSLGIAR